jgi:hypothetical protein
MNTTDTCTEPEAIKLAGVSAKTLHRFKESGYLDVTDTDQGQTLYSRRQLVEIFGGGDADEQIRSASAADTTATVSEDVSPNYPEEELSKCSAPVKGDIDNLVSTIDRSQERELQRLQNLIDIQERILDSKDSEIADLKSQRTWLQERIERLEEKSERDQILLLSETQTIRSLISYQENRRSPVRQLLEWIGVTKPETETEGATAKTTRTPSAHGNRAIEVQKVAND